MWMASSMMFSWYVVTFDSYNRIYGSLGCCRRLDGLVVDLRGDRPHWRRTYAEMEHQTARDTTEGRPKPLGLRGAMMADRIGKSHDKY